MVEKVKPVTYVFGPTRYEVCGDGQWEYIMNPEIIVIDLWSVVPDLAKQGRHLTGTPVAGLHKYVAEQLQAGSTVYFCAGKAHDPFWRQLIEQFLERSGISSVFVTHGIPDGFTLFISRNAFEFHECFPTSQRH